MGRKVNLDELVDTQTVAKILGLAYRNTVSEYQARYQACPVTSSTWVVVVSSWLRTELERWTAHHHAWSTPQRSGR